MTADQEIALGRALAATAKIESEARRKYESGIAPPDPVRPPPRPIVVAGHVFPNCASLARAAAVPEHRVRMLRDAGKLYRLEPGHRAVPVVVRGQFYLSRTCAARALGVSRSGLATLIAKGRVDRVGTGTGMGQRRQVEIHGIRYSSLAEASRVLGLNISTVKSAFRRGRLDSLGTGGPKNSVTRSSATAFCDQQHQQEAA